MNPIDELITHSSVYLYSPSWDELNEKGRKAVEEYAAERVVDLYELSHIAESDDRLRPDTFWVLGCLSGAVHRDLSTFTTLGKLSRAMGYRKAFMLEDLADLEAHGYFPYIEKAHPPMYRVLMGLLHPNEETK